VQYRDESVRELGGEGICALESRREEWWSNLCAHGGRDCLSSNGWRGTPVWMRPSVAGRAAVFSGGSTRRGLKSTLSWNLQNILFTNELQRRLVRASATASPCTPGSLRLTSTAVRIRLSMGFGLDT
jgi:hypothetical protein